MRYIFQIKEKNIANITFREAVSDEKAWEEAERWHKEVGEILLKRGKLTVKRFDTHYPLVPNPKEKESGTTTHP